MKKAVSRTSKNEWAGAVLDLSPSAIRQELLSDYAFLKATGIETTARVVLSRGQCVVERPKLFAAVRQVYSTRLPQTVQSENGETWILDLAQPTPAINLLLKNGGAALRLAPIAPLHEDSGVRLEGIDFAERSGLPKVISSQWRKVVAARSLTDDEYGAYQRALEATRAAVAKKIRAEVEEGRGTLGTLVPTRREYYESLIGPASVGMTRHEFIAKNFLNWHLSEFDRSPGDRVRELLPCCLHSDLVKALATLDLPPEELIAILAWAAESKDPVSIGAAIELSVGKHANNSDIAARVSTMIDLLLADDPEFEGGMFSVLSGTFVFVDGELARAGVLRGLPPFYRRMCSGLQAFQIRQAMSDLSADPVNFMQWGLLQRQHFFALQTCLDAVDAPRWQSGFALPDQLKTEILSRIAMLISTLDPEGVPDHLIEWQAPGNALEAALNFPQRYYPGPLEGETPSPANVPDEIAENLRSQLSARPVTTRSFVAFANSSLVWNLSGEFVDAAIEALESVPGFLAEIESREQLWATMHGLSKVAANARSVPLAEAVRSSVFRHRHGFDHAIGYVEALRILYTAGTAHGDVDRFMDWIADIADKLAFDDLSAYDARNILNDLDHWAFLDPRFYPKLAKGRAALSAYLSTIAS